jgi:hypothetical protein
MVLVGKPEQRTTWKTYKYTGDNFKTDLLRWDEGVDWIILVYGRDSWHAVLNAVMKLQVP